MMGRQWCFRFEATPYVILFVERSGSTYLVTALKAQPDMLALTEKFDAMRQEGRTAAEQLAWADAFLTPPLVGRHRAIGFKTKVVDVLDREGFARLLRARGCRIVQLHRRNTVKAAVSTLNARRQWEVSGNWNLLSESTRLPPFAVDPEKFDALLRERSELDRDLEAYVEELGLPTLKLVYEDLLQDAEGFVGKTLAFLNGRARALPGLTLKNTQDDLRAAIVNFDELRARYAGTRYAPMFDEGLVPA